MVSSKKPALIFIHGFRGSHLGLEKVASYFPDYDVYLPDLPPFGEAGPMESYSDEDYAKYVVNYIRAKKLKQPILIGHSMGSIVSSIVAEKYPEAINQKLVLMSPISARTSKFFGNLQPLVLVIPNRLISWITTKFLFIPKNRKLFKETLVITNKCGAKNAGRKAVKKAAQFSASNCIADYKFDKKTLFISGSNDRLMPRKNTDKLSAEINAASVYIPDSGHLINYEHPEEVAKAIREFIES